MKLKYHALCKFFYITTLLVLTLPSTLYSRYIGSDVEAKNIKLLTPEEQIKHFKLAPGFEIELVASEAMGIKKVVDIAFDTQGRLWACTASEYPADAFGANTNFRQMLDKKGVKMDQRVIDLWEKGGIDEVLIFPNPTAKSPGKPVLFAGGRALPMGVLPYKNGVLVIEGPRLLFLEDTNGDNLADEKTILAEGFGAQDTHTGAHGLKYMPGNWVTILNGVLCWGNIKDRSGKVTPYDRSGVAYIRPNGYDFHIASKGFQNIWGFYIGKNGQTWMHEANNVGYPLAPYYEKTAYPMTTPKKDFYREYMLPFPPTVGEKDKPVDLEGSALSGLEKSDDLENGFPEEWQKRFLVAHPMPSKIQSMTATQRKDQSYEILRGPDFLSCSDPNFRPVDVEFGPDGCLYIVDWYNPVISHNGVSREDPRRDKRMTRIWRVRHSSQKKYPKPANLRKAPSSELVGYLTSKNSWEQESAWKEISERQDKNIIPQLTKIAADKSQIERNRIHAIWSLENLEYFNKELWSSLLTDKNHYIRAQALRALRKVQPDLNITFPILKELAAKETRFTIIKELLHYMGEATSFTPDHISWMMQWRSKVAPKYQSRKFIHHHVPDWKTYVPNHYQDLIRVALELQPEAVIAFFKKSDADAGHLNFLGQYIVPHLDKKYFLALADNFNVKDLENGAIKKLIFSNLANAKFSSLAKEYMASLSPEQQVTEFISTQAPLSPQFKSLVKAALDTLLKSSTKTAQELYLKAVISTKEVVGINGKDSVSDYLKKLQKNHSGLMPLALNAFTKANLSLPSLYESYTGNDHSNLTKSYAYLGKVLFSPKNKWQAEVDSLRTYQNSLQAFEKEQLYTIFAEYPKTLGALFAALGKVPMKDVNQHYDMFRFLTERYAALLPRTPYHKLSAINFDNLYKALKVATPVKERKAQYTRWQKVDSKTGNASAGQTTFQALCLACHTFQGKGQGIAPALDGTGNRPLEGLITAIVDPDAGVESVYFKTHIQLNNGQHQTGLLRNEDGSKYLYQMGGGKIKIAASDISYIHTSQRSFMPDFFVKSMSDASIADLLKYLKSLK